LSRIIEENDNDLSKSRIEADKGSRFAEDLDKNLF
jgi:hypothetical protein